MHKVLPLNSTSLRLTLYRTGATLVLAAIALPLLAGSKSNPWEQTDWQHWSRKDADAVLYHSPWISICCREWNDGKHGTDPASVGISAAIVSSVTVRQALVRRMELSHLYDAMEPTRRQEMDRKIAACLDQKFDDRIVVTSSYEFTDIEKLMGNAPKDLQKKIPPEEIKQQQSNWIYLLTSDGRKIPKLSPKPSESVAQTCAGLTNNLDAYPNALYGPNHEMAFPRFVNGQPTIQPGDKMVRLKVDLQGAVFEFPIDKLIHQGKPDF